MRFPLIDFGALLALSLSVSQIDRTLFDHLNQTHDQVHGIGVINRLAVTACAAVTLAGKPRVFATLIACDFTGGLVIVIPGINHGSALAYVMLS